MISEIPVESPAAVTVKRLTLDSFRNYVHLSLDLEPGLNVLFGRNAQGKTNVLEALFLLSTTRLLRGARDAEAILEGASKATVEAQLAPFDSALSMALEAGKRKLAQLNGMKLPRAADLIGRLPTVCVSALDMEIVRGSPEDRRLFMDLELSQLSPSFLNHLTHYKRSLEQRNALLRRAQDMRVQEEEFVVWEEPMAEHGAAIRTMRMSLVSELSPLAAQHQAFLASKESLEVVYEAKDEGTNAEALGLLMAQNREREIARGSSNIGPHRDDLAIVVEGRDARYFGSQGQQRTAVLALKLAAHRRQRKILGSAPLLLLDDILSDLDEGRRRRLVEWILAEARQAILTCTEPEAAGSELLARARLFEVVSGTVSPRD